MGKGTGLVLALSGALALGACSSDRVSNYSDSPKPAYNASSSSGTLSGQSDHRRESYAPFKMLGYLVISYDSKLLGKEMSRKDFLDNFRPDGFEICDITDEGSWDFRFVDLDGNGRVDCSDEVLFRRSSNIFGSWGAVDSQHLGGGADLTLVLGEIYKEVQSYDSDLSR